MRLTITRMTIENFKGIRHMTVDLAPKQTQITGANGTGKSSIVDAFCWCMFNRDAAGNAPGSDAFREKPLGDDGKEIHNLDTSVEMICTLDGSPFNVKRVQRENWVKRRGATQPTYSGNVSTYWINEVEVKQNEFKERISQIASEELFRLLGTLSAFNALEWKKRRQQLINLSDTDVDGMLLSTDEYRPIADECAQRGIGVDDLRKVLISQRKLANDELKAFPIRIDEARRNLPTFGKTEIADAQYIVNDTTRDIERIDASIAEAMSQSGAESLKTQRYALEAELVSHRQRLRADMEHIRREIKSEMDLCRRMQVGASTGLTTARNKVSDLQGRVQKEEAKRQQLRAQYTAAYEAQYTGSVNTICPTCGQTIPEDQVINAQNAAREEFALMRKQNLASIKTAGQASAAAIAEMQQEIERNQALIVERQQELEKLTSRIAELEKQLAGVPSEPDYSKEPRIAEIESQLEKLKSDMQESPETKVTNLKQRRDELVEIVRRNNAILARRDAAIETEQRIKALEHAQREAADDVGELETKLILLEKFVMDRCAALESSINDKFPTLRWKLFDIQINGAIVDTCVCMIPCSSGLVSYESANTAAQVNADVEIVNVLSEHYGVNIPLFIDNSERVNTLASTDSQLITLAVSGSELEINHKEA